MSDKLTSQIAEIRRELAGKNVPNEGSLIELLNRTEKVCRGLSENIQKTVKGYQTAKAWGIDVPELATESNSAVMNGPLGLANRNELSTDPRPELRGNLKLLNDLRSGLRQQR